jgi:hypothetical protein
MIGSTSSWAKRLKRNKHRWPNPEESTGEYYGKMGLDHSCWEAVNTARQTFIQIADEIKVHLEKHSDPVLKPVTWTIYMIGRTKNTAKPTIMFISKEEDCRKKVRKTVEESGILERYLGVRVGDCSRPPDFDKLVELAIEDSVIPESAGRNTTNLFPSDQDEEKHRPGGILREISSTVCGSRIFISTGENATSSRRATAGGIFRSGDRFFYLTVAHAFVPSSDHTAASITENSDSDFEFDIGGDLDSDLDSEQEERDLVEKTSRGSVTPERSEYESSDDTEIPIDARPSLVSYLDVGSGRESCDEVSSREVDTDTTPLDYRSHSFKDFGQVFMKSLELDYCLIEINKLELQTFNRIYSNHSLLQETLYPERVVGTLPSNTNVFAVTGSTGLLKGTLCGTPSFIIRQGSTRQRELWTVRLDGRLYGGDCGSWVVEARSGDLLGHIVSGCPETGVAYVVPAYLVLEDAKTRFGLELKLSIAGNTSTSGNSQQVIVRAKDIPCGNCENQDYTENSRDGMDKGPEQMEDKTHTVLKYYAEEEQATEKDVYNTMQSTADNFSKTFDDDVESSNSDSDLTTLTIQTDEDGFRGKYVAAEPSLLCDFVIAGCKVEYPVTQFEALYDHSLLHFQNMPPPPKCICPFCPAEFEDILHPYDNWRRRMIHCRDHLEVEGYSKPRPDFWLIEYLGKNGLISAHDLVHATRYTERPHVDGLVSRNFITPEARARNERNERNEGSAVDLRKEDRERKKTSQKKDNIRLHERTPVVSHQDSMGSAN